MKPLHEELREIREDRGISIRRISEETRIRPHLLEAIEAGDFTVLPKPYIRAFLREYAQAVGIDPDRVIARLDNKVPSVLEAVTPSAEEVRETREAVGPESIADPIENEHITAPNVADEENPELQETRDEPDMLPIIEETVENPEPADEEHELDFEPSATVPEPDYHESGSVSAVPEDEEVLDDAEKQESTETSSPEPVERTPARGRGKRKRGKRRQSGETSGNPGTSKNSAVSTESSVGAASLGEDEISGNPGHSKKNVDSTESYASEDSRVVTDPEPPVKTHFSAKKQLEASASLMPEPIQPSVAASAPVPPSTPQSMAPTAPKKRVNIEEPRSSNALFFIVFFLLIVLAAAAIFWMNSGG